MQLSAETEHKIASDKNLHASTQDGIASAVALGAGESYVGAFAVFLKATPLQLALLGAFPPLIGALAQFAGVQLLERVKSRRGLTSVLISLQSSLWLSLGLLPFLFDEPLNSVAALIALMSIYHMLSGVIAPIWSSLIGDLIPVEIRGAFFGVRNRAALISAFGSLVLAGIVLSLTERYEIAVAGFVVIFLASSFARSMASYWIACHDDPHHEYTQEDRFSFLQFLRRIPKSNFGRFVVVSALIHFGMYIAGPFFAAYLLNDVQVSYFGYMVLIGTTMVGQFLTMRRWGQLSDLYGNKRILEVCSVGLCFFPLGFLVSSNFWYLLVVHLLGGLFTAGFSLSLGNFLFDAVSPSKRGRCVAYQAVFNGAGIFLGSMVGSFLVKNSLFSVPLTVLFGQTSSAFLFRRIQFTPDMLPGDVLGVNVFDAKTSEFHFVHGPVFAHIVLADELNRTGPKVQAAFLECMAESQVTIDNVTHSLDKLFFVVGTQNPLDLAGTYPLPIVQLDRFILKIPMSYVDSETELQILEQHTEITHSAESLDPVCSRSEIIEAQTLSQKVHMSAPIRQTIVDIVQATRNNPMLQFGASTRAAIMLQQALRSYALIQKRDYVDEDDLKFILPFVLLHRIRFQGGVSDPRKALDELVAPFLEKLVRL